MLDKLSSGLKGAMKKLMSSKYATEELINSVIKEIQRALIQSDVNIRLVLDLTKNIKKEAKKTSVNGLNKKEEIIKVVYDELVKFVGTGGELSIDKTPYKILLVGLFGNGKTTTAGKLAKYYKKKGYKVALMQTDTYRPAAFKQLKQLGEQINVPVFGEVLTNQVPMAKDLYLKYIKDLSKYDMIIVDSAGRDALNEELIEEISDLNKTISPDDVFLVMGSDVGQSAQSQATAFKENTNVSGVIISRMDGSGKGGGALSACNVAQVPVRFLGVGEKIDDLEVFEPVKFISQLIGFGDLDSLLEKAKEAIDEDSAQNLAEKFMTGDMNLIDIFDQLKAMKKLGPMSKVMNLIPGLSMANVPSDLLKKEEKKLDFWKFAMQSMTKSELEDPKIITESRLKRISDGSGVSKATIKDLFKMHNQMKKFSKMFKGDKFNMNKAMKKYKGMPIDKMMNSMQDIDFDKLNENK